MPIVGKFFPSQKSQERVFLLLRRHWFTYVSFLAIVLIMAIPLFVLAAYWLIYPDNFLAAAGNIAIVLGAIYALSINAVLLYGFIDYYLDVYIVTDERIVDVEQNGFFKRKIAELHLHQVQDVSARVEGPFPTFFHYGDIMIQTAGERENFVFKSIPNPYRVSKMIVDLHEAQLEALLKTEDKEITAKIIDNTGEGKMDELNNKDEGPIIESGNFQLARQRTKEFLDNKITDEDLREEVNQQYSQKSSENIIKSIEKTKKAEAGSNTKIILKKDLQGEMHENEEIDI